MPRNILVVAAIIILLLGAVLAWTILWDDPSLQTLNPEGDSPAKSVAEKPVDALPVKTVSAVDEKDISAEKVDDEQAVDEKNSEPKPDTRIVVKITKIAEAEGNLRVAIYNDATGWTADMNSHLSENQFELKVVEAKVDSVECVFEHLPSGTYAISLYHDVDKSEKMNMVKKLIGEIPNEPFGFSNNFDPFRRFRAPRMRDCSFVVVEGTPQVISIELQ